ncbi:uncharacterized protein LOC143084113 [Mytilus galloprovincialis]|uniref:uncharacterized protein LOC143084113 n=1 Tax=Mytilus galloprovincialis TaxID=29158 RepID=UPI003F7C1449
MAFKRLRYQFARSIIDRLFGPRAHKEFPRDTRLSGNGCSGEGFYPSKKKRGSEYWSKGVDLEIEYHEDIVAPFPGYITRTNRDDEVVIKATGGSLQDVNIYITNIHPEGVDHPSDENDKGKLIAAGVKIGTATHSGCMNHIHVAFEKGEEGFIDPTRFFEGRPFSVPTWDQKCDDFKLVWKFETIAEGCILCLGEEDPAEDTSPEITSKVDQPSDLSSSDNPGSEVSSIKSDPGGMYNKFESSGVRKKRSLFGGSDKKKCPLLSFTMPENLVCTFDPMCMGVECCINVKLFMFLHTVKAYARFDPCQMEFNYGIDDWHNSIKLDIHIDVDWSKFFSKEAVLERLKNAGKSAAKQITQAAAGEILNALGLPKNLLLSTGPCPRPGKMTKGQLTEELKHRGLVVTGTDDERIQRLEDDDRSTERNIPISKDIQIKLNIDKDDDLKMFIIDFGLKIVVGEKPLIDQYLLTKQEIPIPICNENFTLPGGGSFAGFLTALGGKLTGQAFDLVIKEMGLETTFKKIHFSIPEGPKDCPVDINPQKYLPAAIRNMLRCEMPQNCFGLNCGLDLSFKLPFGDFHVSYNIPFWFKISPCDFDIDIKFGPFQHKTVLLNYDWGTPGVLTIGKGDRPPITINYSIDKMPNGQGFIVDVKITICFPLGDDPFCIPEKGLHMLQHQEIPACSKNFTDMMKNFSVSEIAKDFGLELKAGLKEGAVQFILERLGLEEFFSGPKCDKRRPPYSPAVQGWNNAFP